MHVNNSNGIKIGKDDSDSLINLLEWHYDIEGNTA